MVFKNQKNLEKVEFFVFFLVLDVFFINYALKLYSYYFFIIIWFSIYMNLYFTVRIYTTLYTPFVNMF